ncbi:hypothetical protein L2D14_00785 [Thalassospiraceae bacterium LMO-JJ14]|nr:hypothetical protein L2D14_00785 [Thalassospiraceae bacterium LMO-JJ14]
MRPVSDIAALEQFGRTRLSESFYMRDFLYSEISSFYGIPNIPNDPELAIAAGKRLCNELLEPISKSFGGIAIRSAYRSSSVNGFGHQQRLNCGSNHYNSGKHIWDRLDNFGYMGATACIVVPWFADRYEEGADWRSLAWWIHDHLPYSRLFFFPKLAAFNITWSENPVRRIDSYISPKGCLTKPGMANHKPRHERSYVGFPAYSGF